MRHRVHGYRLSRNTSQRKLLRRNLINDLFEHERIRTTEAKARAIRGEAERVITLAKRGLKSDDAARQVHARRMVMRRLANKDMARKVFDEIAPRYEERPGGYTRMLKLGERQGDAARMVMLELVEE